MFKTANVTRIRMANDQCLKIRTSEKRNLSRSSFFSSSTLTSTWSLAGTVAELYANHRRKYISINGTPVASTPRRRFTFAFHAFTDFSLRWPTLRSLGDGKLRPTTMTTTTMMTTTSAPPDSLVLFHLCLASFLPPSLPFPPRRRFPSDVFHCRPLFRLLLLTSFVRTSLQRKKGEKSARATTGRDESEEKKGTGDRLEVSLCSLAQNKISSSMNKVDTSPK